MKLSKQQLKTSTRHYIKKCAGAVCTSKLHESARNSSIRRCELNYALRLFGYFSAVGLKLQIKSFLRCIEITMTFRQCLSNGISLNNYVRIVSQTIEPFSIMFP